MLFRHAGGGRFRECRNNLTLARRSVVTKATRCSHAAALFFILAFVLGFVTVGLMPAMAVDLYGCRGDQACVKAAEATKCDAVCQRVCKEYRFDAAGCYAAWGPKFEFLRGQLTAQKRGTK
jgi:hypothetical protein